MESDIRHRGWVAVVWRVAAGLQVEGTVNFGPNMVILLQTLGARRRYVVGAYMPPNKDPGVHCVEKATKSALKGVEVILLGDLNLRLREPRNEREEDLATALANPGLVNRTDHLPPRRQYRGEECWAWIMRQKGPQVTGQGEYVLSTDRIFLPIQG